MSPQQASIPRDPGSPKLRMVSWNLNEPMRFVPVMKDTLCSLSENMTLRVSIWQPFLRASSVTCLSQIPPDRGGAIPTSQTPLSPHQQLRQQAKGPMESIH